VLLFLTIFLISGCGSSSSTADETLSLNENNITSSVTEVKTLDEEEFSDGVVQHDIEIPVESNDVVVSIINVSEGTQFLDSDGEVVTEAPKLVMLQRQSSSTTTTTEESTTTNIAKNEFSFVTEEGEKLVPTEPVTIAMAAPAGAKPGEKVRVEMPDDGVEKAEGQEKLTFFIVDANGNINVVVFPQAFETLDVVVIIIERVIVAVLVEPLTTGAEGGN
nr:hypothetical protein [Campylobacterota bacterium]